MKRAVVGGALFAAVGVLAAMACDLFHSTDFATLCEVSPTADACADGPRMPEAGPPPATNFCAWDPMTAYGHATHACAWLSACELPLGNNDFGPCMISALLAYDCATNPDRPVRGALHAYWDTLWQVGSCADVDRAVFPGAGPADQVQSCRNGGGFTACGAAYDGGDNSGVRVECDEAGAPARGESCLAQGRTCGGGTCVASAGGACVPGCEGTTLHDCDDAGVDRGTSCAVFGAGLCVATDAGPACASTNASPCTPTQAVACSGAGVAQGCPSGTSESVDCNVLTGAGSCNAGPATPGWDVSSACLAAATCPPDTCGNGGDMLVSCARGLAFTASCSQMRLGPCAPVMTFDGPRVACGRPP